MSEQSQRGKFREKKKEKANPRGARGTAKGLRWRERGEGRRREEGLAEASRKGVGVVSRELAELSTAAKSLPKSIFGEKWGKVEEEEESR